jgi:uncharacterized protein (DUF427 family)
MKPIPITPKPGQESVWDYPRPARLENIDRHIKIIFNDTIIAETKQAKRVIETSHPPTYYILETDIILEYFTQTSRQTFCEWKGWATYYDITVVDRMVGNAAWRFFAPSPNFLAIENYYAFYANLMDACYVDGELVTPQPGNFYGGWITKDIVGPFKGEPGTMGW